ncbi:MAG: T9SS type A sorting domain-containing protein [Saprospiraceae bacterium]|nr:T9SS type A sorting domain-containing protein [Saprospiraceae bacterium]MCF8252851.1 T9SS type A sorting domain-containing protein [Saprospiraceae bacterium]MCF8283306.1 T9SS type A sorting domain-containing protein [Bacteroidales bacterium]MCF8314403.1 T9SS type A sorting domain-containing protein [Saprospiraceae bacterium]MCF8443293.1 T9SS type A sorting domain-containing protein [Saprospiraceae bacterium]
MRCSLLFSFCLLFTSAPSAFSQNEILGGGIHVEQIGGCNANSVRVEALIYVNKDPAFPIPDSISIHWGDGISNKIGRISTIVLPGQISYLTYTGEYTYDGPGTYSITIEDCCLTKAFINFDLEPSVSFKVGALYTLFNGQFQGCNNTAKLLSPLVDNGYIGQLINFNPAAFDSDGDSLAYAVFNPLTEFNYHFPNEVMPIPTNQFSINQQTGTITWENPTKAGDYLVGLKVAEYRHQALIAETAHLLDFRIFDLDLSLFPNPTASELTVNFLPAVPDEKLQVRIFNVLGQLVLAEAGVFTSTGYPINVHDFANGVYLLEVEAFGRRWVRKFVKR